MTDPKFAVGDRVRFQGQIAVVQYLSFEDPPEGDYRLVGYQLLFPDGSFSGWHTEDLLTALPSSPAESDK